MTTPLEIMGYFLGKYCTICTVTTGLKLNHESCISYFAGIIEYIGENGIVTRNPHTNGKNYFLMKHVIGILEEQELNPNDPEQAKVIEEIKKHGAAKEQAKVIEEMKKHAAAKEQSAGPMVNEKTQERSPWVNPSQIADMAKKAKDAYRRP
jgi:hypothetical protein